MNKPNVGDKVTVALYIDDMKFPDLPQEVEVIRVFDNLEESWDPNGELALAQSEVDECVGKKGEWYILFDAEDGTGSAASYEVVDGTPAS